MNCILHVLTAMKMVYDTILWIKETADKTIEFILNQVDKNTPLSIFWYGGEPLLDLKHIRYITEKLKEHSDKYESYSASIVTNGYLLTKDVAYQLKKLDIDNVQITLVGPAKIHKREDI